MLRRLLIVVVPVCLLAAAFGRPALAAPNHTVDTAHFTVAYDSDPTQPDFATFAQASQVAADAERAYAAEVGWGFDAPVALPSGKLLITIVDLSTKPGISYEWIWGAAAPPTWVAIDLAKTQLDSPDEANTLASAVLLMISARYWIPAGAATRDESENWLMTGPGAWAGFKVDGYSSPGTIGPPDIPLDCHDYNQKFQMCSTDGYTNGGDSRWPFYEMLAQRYGASFLKSVWQNAQLSGALNGLGNAIAAKGGSIADAANDYAVRAIAHGWGIKTLDALAPKVTGSTISTGAISGATRSATVSVDHLSSKVVKLTRGDGHAEHACFAATLTLSVAIPTGTNSRPYFMWTRDQAAQPFAVSGSTATLTVPWDTCTWSTDVAYVVLPNDSFAVDSAVFTISGTLAVDQTKPATPGPDPTPATVTGPVVAVPTADVAPEITVSGPFVLQLSPKSQTLRLIVQSDGEGAVHGTLGTLDLGTAHIRPGGNDVRFTVPKSALSALRRSSAAGTNVLTLTPVSTSGAVSGTPVTRRVKVAKK